jgi:hypothetical protein
MSLRPIRLRYATVCSRCGRGLPSGSRGVWNREARKAICIECFDADRVLSPGEAEAPELDRGEAGASAARRYTALHDRRERHARNKLGRFSGAYLALTSEPQSTRAWAVGAKGERELGAFLQPLDDSHTTYVFHDRRIPGSRANIDHLIVGAGGIFVIDAKRYEGKVRRVDKGGWFSIDERLYVGRRDCTTLVAQMAKQVDAVRRVLAPSGDDVPVTPVLCFVGAEWSLFPRPFQLAGVWVEWPRSLRERILRGGPLPPEHVGSLAQRLGTSLRSA